MSFVNKLSAGNSLRLISKVNRSGSLKTVYRKMASLRVDPAKAMIDEPVRIAVRGLTPGQAVTLTASVQDDGPLFRSYSHYHADGHGRLDLGAQASASGTYEGVEPMGPFWSMVPEGGYESGYRMRKKNIMGPHRISVAVLDGHQNPDTGSGVERHPGLIDLYGTTGGLAEYRAALLASRGFTVLALAYFNYDDLPKKIDPLDLHYFDEAIDYLYSHPNVIQGGIGVIGISKGGEIALHMSTTSCKVKAAASINGFHFFSTARHLYNGKTFPATLPALEEAEFRDAIISLRTAYLKAKHIDENLIPIENAKGASLLILQGVDDELVDSGCAAQLALRLCQHGYRDFEVHMYQGTGHLLEPPYLPVCPANYHSVFKVMLGCGGTPKYHSRASQDSWNRILEFFKEKLETQNNVRSHL